jgi:two-component system LytT family response regulator
MMNAVIVDDKPINAQTLQSLLQDYCTTVTVIGMANGIEEAFEVINNTKPDIVFLDIEMPTGSGFDLLRKFTNVFFEVIFTTAYSQYAIEAFRKNALDYLLKPINIPDLQQAVNKATKQMALKDVKNNLTKYLKPLQALIPSKISLPTQEGLLFINPEEIIRCEASGSYSNIYLNTGKKIVVSMLLRQFEEMLSPSQFLRIHNSHIINVRFVLQYLKGRGGTVLMQDGTKVEVAASKKNDFLEAMKHPL